MTINRRLLGTALLGFALPAHAQPRPVRLKVLIGFTAGGPPDIVLRRIAAGLRTHLGIPVVVENVVGASGTIAAAAVARAAPDGSVLLFGTAANLAIAPWLSGKPAYDPIADFAPVAEVARGPLVWLVRADAPARNMAEFLAWARAVPGQLNFGTPGTGSAHHLAAELLMRATGVRLVHVPYRTPLNPALLSGEVEAMYQSLPSPLPLLESGRFRALAVSGQHRLRLLPQVATLEEQGIRGANADSWWGFVAPAGTPPGIVAQLNAVIQAVLRDPELASLLGTWGFETQASTPHAFAHYIAEENSRWRALIRSLALRTE